MKEYKVILTWEAIYDVTDIADYIELNFGENYADRFQLEIQEEIERLKLLGNIYGKTQIMYRGYTIHKKPFPPSVIFYVIREQEIHVLRVIREERDLKHLLQEREAYSYPNQSQIPL